MYRVILMYLLVMNILALMIYGIDKYKAIHNQYRISEKTLIILAILGGSIGALSGMMIFRHKTHKLKFKLGVPFILIIQILIPILYYIYFV